MMLKGVGLIFAIIFIVMGVSGFIPFLIHHQRLFGFFAVSAVLNIFYLLTGLVALSASVSADHMKLYFKIMGVVYALIAILGFSLNGHFAFLEINLADSFFHVIMAVIALYLGFTSKLAARARR